MESSSNIEWPVEMLERILQFLAMAGASFAWQHLAYLIHKNEALKRAAKQMHRPLILSIGFHSKVTSTQFCIPFVTATVACIEIDWGDDTPNQVIERVGQGYALHEYFDGAGREYQVRVFPYVERCKIGGGVKLRGKIRED
jgi:hypothetical protein